MKSFLGRFRYNRLASTFTVLITLSAGILIGSAVAHQVRGQESQVNSSDAAPLKIPAPHELPTDFTRIAKEVGPAVVNINTQILPKQQRNRRGPHYMQPSPDQQQPPDDGNGDDNGDQDQGPQTGPQGGDQGQGQGGLQDFFNRFFGMGPDQGGPDDSGQERESLGSGFIVDPRGYIITNNHVVEKADRIFVKLASDPDGNQGRPAKVIGVDKATDIAVLKIQTSTPLPTVKMGNSDGVEVGDWVEAIGEPFGLARTVTAGIISSKNRTVQPGTEGEFQHFLQTDAAINPGNSGGPLLNMDGEVIGMNTAIYTESAGNQGIGFAMPSNSIIDVYNDLIGPEHKVIRGSIGISFQPNLPSAVARVYGFKSGVIISLVGPGQPAAKAGLKVGDIITTINGKPVKDGDDLVSMISSYKPGTGVDIGYLRDGKPMHANVIVGDRDKVLEAMNNIGNENQGGGSSSGPSNATPAKLGITVQDLPQGAPAGLHGVLIESVKPGSFADEINVSQFQGWVITSVNRHPVNNVQDFQTIVAGLHTGDDVVFNVVDPRHPNAGNELLGGTLR
ncbi:MAG TPA: trypsin-like peptidase domain-containing protein [Acidobacteriaceae bacterium]|jgi:serine protease Do|nr:trypsin-like peptidase domain-containing protein [Acidobacteriaceae bacterium]